MSQLKIFFISFFINFIFICVIYPFLKNKIVAIPNKRSSHKKKIPTAGGISFVITGTILSAIYGFWQPFLIIPLAVVGIIDDCILVKSRTKYIFQIITSTFLLYFYRDFYIFFEEFNLLVTFIFSILILIALTGFINLVNFMDGLDGLVTGCSLIIFVCISITSNLQLIPLAGCLFAFLIFNWHPAKIFMGDVGSTFLGTILGVIILNSTDLLNLTSRLLLISPFLADAVICIIRRFFAGEVIFTPHKLHLFQRLHQAGYRHDQISLFYILSTFLLSVFYYYENLVLLFIFSTLIIIIGIILDKYFAIPFKKALKSNY